MVLCRVRDRKQSWKKAQPKPKLRGEVRREAKFSAGVGLQRGCQGKWQATKWVFYWTIFHLDYGWWSLSKAYPTPCVEATVRWERNPRAPIGAGWEKGSQKKGWAAERLLPWLHFHMNGAWESWSKAEPSMMVSIRVRREPKSRATFGVEQQRTSKEVAEYKKTYSLTTFSSRSCPGVLAWGSAKVKT